MGCQFHQRAEAHFGEGCLAAPGRGLGHALEYRLGVAQTQLRAVVTDQSQTLEEAARMTVLLGQRPQGVAQDGEKGLQVIFWRRKLKAASEMRKRRCKAMWLAKEP